MFVTVDILGHKKPKTGSGEQRHLQVVLFAFLQIFGSNLLALLSQYQVHITRYSVYLIPLVFTYITCISIIDATSKFYSIPSNIDDLSF